MRTLSWAPCSIHLHVSCLLPPIQAAEDVQENMLVNSGPAEHTHKLDRSSYSCRAALHNQLT